MSEVSAGFKEFADFVAETTKEGTMQEETAGVGIAVAMVLDIFFSKIDLSELERKVLFGQLAELLAPIDCAVKSQKGIDDDEEVQGYRRFVMHEIGEILKHTQEAA